MRKPVTIHMEGNDGTRQARAKGFVGCRRAFRAFLNAAGVDCARISILPGGSRVETYKKFCEQIETFGSAEFVYLLVDSDSEVKSHLSHPTPQPWSHLATCNIGRPKYVHDDNAHLMVRSMECWISSDTDTLHKHFGQGFDASAIPAVEGLEGRSPAELLHALNKAVKDTQTKKYNKGKHSYQLLRKISPRKVMAASPWAKRLIETLKHWNLHN